MKSLLDELSPPRWKRLTTCIKHSWFSDDVFLIKREIRRMEGQWRLSKTLENWNKYKLCRAQYTQSASFYNAKVMCYRSVISNCGKDAKRLFNTVSGLLGIDKNDNPFPEDANSTALDNSFASYFHSKIMKIRWELEHYTPLLASHPSSVRRFQSLRPSVRIHSHQHNKISQTYYSNCWRMPLSLD